MKKVFLYNSQKIFLVVCLILFSSMGKIYSQNIINFKKYSAYKKSLNLLYARIINGSITKKAAKTELDSLKKLPYSNTKEFSFLIQQELPLYIAGLKVKIDSTEVYIVKKGDFLTKIARKSYENSSKWPVIYDINKKRIKNPNLIYPNQKIRIPVIVQTKKIDSLKAKKIEAVLKLDSNKKLPKQQNAAEEDSAKTNQLLKKMMSSIVKGEKKSTLKKSDFSGIDGLIIDETESKIGHDFYDKFFSNWTPPKNAKNYTITISEKPLPRLGTQITIEINDTPIFKRFVQPRYEIVQQMALQGVSITYSYLENYARVQKELGGEDMQGTGIF